MCAFRGSSLVRRMYESIRRLRYVGNVRQRCSAVLNQNMIYTLISHSAAKLTVVIKLTPILMVSQTFIATPPRATLKRFSATCKAALTCSSWLLCLTSPVASYFVLCNLTSYSCKWRSCTRAWRYLWKMQWAKQEITSIYALEISSSLAERSENLAWCTRAQCPRAHVYFVHLFRFLTNLQLTWKYTLFIFYATAYFLLLLFTFPFLHFYLYFISVHNRLVYSIVYSIYISF